VPEVAAFESELGHYLARDRARVPPEVVGTSCCSLGMLIALRALDIGSGHEVITTPMTFAATTNAILQAGAWPVLADVEPETGLIDPAAVERAVGPRTRAILPVHLYGQLADMPALRAIADAHELAIVEDSAHGIEIERDGVRPSDLSEAAVFSFYATKTLTSGDGGAIAVRDPDLAVRLRRLRSHGMTKAVAERHGTVYAHWDLLELGYKANLTDLDAAVLRPQLPRAETRPGAPRADRPPLRGAAAGQRSGARRALAHGFEGAGPARAAWPFEPPPVHGQRPPRPPRRAARGARGRGHRDGRALPLAPHPDLPEAAP